MIWSFQTFHWNFLMALAHFHGLYDTIIASLGTSKTYMGKLTSFICTFTVSTGTFMASTTYTAFIDTAPANTLTTSATNSRRLVAFSQAMQTLVEAAATTTFINAPKDPVLSSSLPCMCPGSPSHRQNSAATLPHARRV